MDPSPRPPVPAGPPQVGVIMGSQSDWDTMQHASAALSELGIPHECRVVSAHRTPDWLFTYASEAAGRPFAVSGTPAKLVQLAQLYGVADLLGLDGSGSGSPSVPSSGVASAPAGSA